MTSGVESDRQVGNFPQAFSHLTLIGGAYALRDADLAEQRDQAPEEMTTGVPMYPVEGQ